MTYTVEDDEYARYYDTLNDDARQAVTPSNPQLDALNVATLTTAELKALPPPTWLVDGLVPVDSTVLLYGASGAGKSFVAVDLACSVATGRAFHGRKVRQGGVLYVAAEGAAGLGQRVDAWEQYNAADAWGATWVKRAVNMFDVSWSSVFIDYVLRMDVLPSLILFDTWARCTVGADENSARDVGVVLEHLERLRAATGATVMPIHHTGKDSSRGARGSSAIKGAMDTELEVSATDQAVTLKTTKQKDAAEAEPIKFTREQVGASCVLTTGGVIVAGKVTTKALETLEALKRIHQPGGMPASKWEAAAPCATSTFYEHIKALLDAGLVVNVGTTSRRLFSPKDDH